MTAGPVEAADGGLGRRLRDSRLAKGLSQTELAGADLSASYVSLLEAGKRSPTPEVLDVLARRLDCTVTYLVKGLDQAASDRARLTLEYAELALRNGEAADALSELTRLLRDTAVLDDEAVWRARRLSAAALEGVGRLEDALVELEALRRDANSSKRYADELQLAVDLVRCYEEIGDVTLAVEIGHSTLERMAGLNLAGTDEHARLVSALIGAYYERGDTARARLLAVSAIAEIEAGGSRNARASVYWNASLTADASGDTPGAVVLAERAVALLSEGDETRALGRLRTALGWLFVRLEPPDLDRALSELAAAKEGLRDAGSQIDLAYVETELGRCELLRGDPLQALEHTAAAAAHLGDAPRVEFAHVLLVQGRALLALDRDAEAVAAYSTAAEMLGAMGVSRQSASAWRELGDAYGDLGLALEAAHAYRTALGAAGIRPAPTASYASREASVADS